MPTIRRGKSPARSRLISAELDDVSEGSVAGDDKVQAIQSNYANEFYDFLKKTLPATAQVGKPVKKFLAFDINVTFPHGINNMDQTLAAIKKKFPLSRFNMKSTYKGTFTLLYMSLTGPRRWCQGIGTLVILVLWMAFVYYWYFG